MYADNQQYPHFELLEIETELILGFKKYRALSPLKKGGQVKPITLSNNFNTWKQYVNGAESFSRVPVKQLLGKPLVIAFYSWHWKEEGTAFITQLNTLNAEVKALGANLVVVTDVADAGLDKAAWDKNLTLNFYVDAQHELAASFGIYHPNSPVWERFSGIDSHVPLLAVYVVSPYQQVTFGHTNWNGEAYFNADELLDTLYQSDVNNKRSA